jgi:hypothetical protein
MSHPSSADKPGHTSHAGLRYRIHERDILVRLAGQTDAPPVLPARPQQGVLDEAEQQLEHGIHVDGVSS